LFEVDLSGDVCLAVGNETHGLTRAALACCDAVGYVPLLGRVGSLNVATAAALGLYEARRQAWHAR
jgi:tRNA (guanosine-2'-O-)-methyltransferase